MVSVQLAERLLPVARPASWPSSSPPVLPVPAPFKQLFPYGGMVRGSLVAVDSLTVALALLAAASAEGTWCAAVGIGGLGLAAVVETGIDLHRFVVVPSPSERWAVAVATLLDGFGIVLVRPPQRASASDERRLVARARERKSVLVTYGAWAAGSIDLTIRIERSEWAGLSGDGDGYGRLTGRRIC